MYVYKSILKVIKDDFLLYLLLLIEYRTRYARVGTDIAFSNPLQVKLVANELALPT
jgi:hypothetical protein